MILFTKHISGTFQTHLHKVNTKYCVFGRCFFCMKDLISMSVDRSYECRIADTFSAQAKMLF